MITEKQKEAVKELCQYVDNFCKENDLSAFMSVAASEDHPDGLEQIAGSIITGKTEHIVGSIYVSYTQIRAHETRHDIG